MCQCSDPGCPECNGDGFGKQECRERAVTVVIRSDGFADDKTGTPMCRGCADDAIACGFFRESISQKIAQRI